MTKDELVHELSMIIGKASVSEYSEVVLAASVLCTLAGVLEGGGSMTDLSDLTVSFSMMELERIAQLEASKMYQ